MRVIEARGVSDGIGRGDAIVMTEPFGFYGNVDPKTGIIIEKGNPFEGQSIKDRILIFPYGKGSTVGSYILYSLKKNGAAPAAIINLETETIVASGSVIAGIPCVDSLKSEILDQIKTGDFLEVDGYVGLIKFLNPATDQQKIIPPKNSPSELLRQYIETRGGIPGETDDQLAEQVVNLLIKDYNMIHVKVTPDQSKCFEVIISKDNTHRK